MKPHPNNACSGKYSDWLEVNLLPECNGSCSWCIEKQGWHPTERASWDSIVAVALGTGKKNIILLGGEPTLHPNLKRVIQCLAIAERNVYLTTNGSMLTREFVCENLSGLAGINISIHEDDLSCNKEITGVDLSPEILFPAVSALNEVGVSVRLNCNCIAGHVDSVKAMMRYIKTLAIPLGVSRVRFAELKGDGDDFVDLTTELSGLPGFTFGRHEPFEHGCSIDGMMYGMHVNFRLLCGLQAPTRRPKPCNPEQSLHGVLYYDGVIYDGWQRGELNDTTKKNNNPESCVGCRY